MACDVRSLRSQACGLGIVNGPSSLHPDVGGRGPSCRLAPCTRPGQNPPDQVFLVGPQEGSAWPLDDVRRTAGQALWGVRAPRSRGTDGGDHDVWPSTSSPASPLLRRSRLPASWAGRPTARGRRKHSQALAVARWGGSALTYCPRRSVTLQKTDRHGLRIGGSRRERRPRLYSGGSRPAIWVNGDGRHKPGRRLSSPRCSPTTPVARRGGPPRRCPAANGRRRRPPPQ